MKQLSIRILFLLLCFITMSSMKATNILEDPPTLYVYTVDNPQATTFSLQSKVQLTFNDDKVRISSDQQEPIEYLFNTIDFISINQKKGDVNFDGIIDISDVVTIVNHILGVSSPLYIHLFGDIDSSHSVDISDVVKIVNVVLGN